MSQFGTDPINETIVKPIDPAIEQQAADALGDASLDQIYGFDKEPEKRTYRLRGLQTGTVISVSAPKDEVFIELGGKAQGVMPFSQFEEEPKVGDTVEVMVERFDPGNTLYICGKKGAASANLDWNSLSVGTVVEGLINGMNKGGLEVKVGNLKGFMPAGQIDLEFHKDISVFLSQKVLCEVTQIDAEKKKLVVSRRKIIEREREEAKGKLFETLAEGQTLKGTVRTVMDYGAFVDLGGADGLIHVSEMSYSRHLRPSDMVKVGDVVEVKVVKFDRESGKVGLSLKASMSDPWKDAETKYSVGTRVTARVVKVENFGAFIEVEDGIQGLLPVSEISWQRIRFPGEVVKINETIPLVVIAIEPGTRKLTFSLKQAGGDPWAGVIEKFPRHAIFEGTVKRVAEFGAFVEVSPDVEGLIHISEMSDQRVRKVEDVVKVGQVVKVRVLEVDPAQRRMALSLKETAGTYTAPTPKVEKKRKTPLKGGLDF